MEERRSWSGESSEEWKEGGDDRRWRKGGVGVGRVVRSGKKEEMMGDGGKEELMGRRGREEM
jgi:hypothetical protein